MADSVEQLAKIKDTQRVVDRLDLIFNDAGGDYGTVKAPTLEHARAILSFVGRQNPFTQIVAQCQVGVGRSQGVVAALGRIAGYESHKLMLRGGTYNRRMFRLLHEAAGIAVPAEPLVSIAVRVKYSPDRFWAFLLCMQRQRYENWEVVAVTDGPNADAAHVEADFKRHHPGAIERLRLIQTAESRGRWGHAYRQNGIDACRGQFIGLSNDDNYYCPGYIEQLMFALEDADIAACQVAHSYSGWAARPAWSDLGCWIARAALVRSVPWEGQEFDSDALYLAKLRARPGVRSAVVNRPLFVHN
jgi:hypothetical protein